MSGPGLCTCWKDKPYETNAPCVYCQLDEARAELDHLRSGIRSEIERYREVAADLQEHDRAARMVGCTFVADRLDALLGAAK